MRRRGVLAFLGTLLDSGPPDTQVLLAVFDLPPDIPVRVLQITDTHLLAEPSGRLLGQTTRETFEAVLALARERFWPPHLILLTGDLVHDEVPPAYCFLARQLEALGIPYLAIPGNHDRADLLAEHLDPDGCAPVRAYDLGGWQLLLLDSTSAGEEGGRLDGSQLAAIEEVLAADSRPALICLHHQPVPVGSAWLDRIGLENGPELIALTRRHPRVRLLLWGHVHQAYDAEQRGLRLLATPSTCVQFLPHRESFAADERSPGFRWLVLQPDGRIETGIERLERHAESVDLGADGY